MGNCPRCEDGYLKTEMGTYRAKDGQLRNGVHLRCHSCDYTEGRRLV